MKIDIVKKKLHQSIIMKYLTISKHSKGSLK